MSVRQVALIVMWVQFQLVLPHLCLGEDLAESACTAYAQRWIQQLNNTSRRDVLIRNTRSDCEFSTGWIKKISNSNNESHWKRTCNDLVLIWTHKKCIYYRDYIDHNSYDPCKDWTRQMYIHCMNRDVSWFYE